MREYTITEQYAAIALSGQDSKHDTMAKRAAVCGIMASRILQDLLIEGIEEHPTDFEAALNKQIKKIKAITSKKRKRIEKDMADILKTEGILTEIPNLLGCDMTYYTANITMREYKCGEAFYQKITESVKAMILEPGEVPLETVALLWLFKESGCFHDIFSIDEQKKVQERMIGLSAENPIYRIIWGQEFHSGIRQTWLHFLNWKHNLFKNPYMEGINLLCPFLDRRQAIFIDMVILGTTVSDRRQAAIHFLEENGHSCEELKIGTETFVKVDNGYYRIFPSTRACKFPIQGIELLPVYR